jgi:predicted Zn-dependent peptidase
MVLQSEVPIGRMRSIASQWLYNKGYRTLEEDMRRLMAVSVEDLKSLVAEFPLTPTTTVTLGPR